jgi:hypothetical protein
MNDSGLPDIMFSAEKHVEKWLADNGYSNISKEILQVNELALKGTGKIENILVQVKTFLSPNRPYKLSEYEADLLTRRANKLRCAAYAAYLVLDSNGNLVGEIKWERLN